MHKKMTQLFKQTAKYFTVDTNKYNMEDMFSDLKTFLGQYKVSFVELQRTYMYIKICVYRIIFMDAITYI